MPCQPSRAERCADKRSPDLTALGRAVRELRARRSLSQEALGFAAGVHRNYVGAIERGEINATFRVLLRLIQGLRVPLSELMLVYERQRSEHDAYDPADRHASIVVD